MIEAARLSGTLDAWHPILPSLTPVAINPVPHRPDCSAHPSLQNFLVDFFVDHWCGVWTTGSGEAHERGCVWPTAQRQCSR
eukprot:206963-Chlamydomonas_euryale.AAC.1